VTIGILSIDIAAADVADPLWISLWAVPASAGGAAWSWYRRRHGNVAVKFCIAIAMLLALATFLLRLVSSANDTRLVLAELLIQLQVFHSFDLPRRKDLGYSIMIGLILIGVAATLSQTLMFAPLLLAFLAIAIPVLVLDYRSRLGLIPQGLKYISADLSLKRLAVFLLVIWGLGLAIFALLPRLPGYQLRNFPVSAPIEFEGQFDGGTIINPGYVREGRAIPGFGSGSTGGDIQAGPGELNRDFYYGFNSRINQNLRGELVPKVVMRVRSQSPGFWRVMAFDRYIGQGWEVSRNQDHQVQTIERPAWSYRFNLPWSITLARTREVIQSYTIVSDLPNLIPALYEPKELYFPSQQVAIDHEGALRSPIPLSEGLTYTVISEVPYRDRTILGQAPIDYPSSITRYYLDVPQAIAQRVRQRTLEILATSPNPLNDPYEQSLYLGQYLKQHYTVQPDLPFLQENEDLVEAFLFKYKGGYPDHFSTVLTMMLRSIDIPARLVVGFAAGEFNPFTGYYVVRNVDAFAMTEVYFNRYGWFTFNPIPGAELIPTSIEESQTFSVLQQFWNWVAGWLPSPVTSFLNQVFEWMTNGLGWAIALLTSLFSRGWVGLLLGLGLLTTLVFAGWLSWQGWHAWGYRRWLSNLPPMEALYQQLLRRLSAQGFHKPPFQTPLEYAHQIRSHYPPTDSKVIDEISRAYVQWRYGKQSPDIRHLHQQLKCLKKRSF
jgi:transglutaminase-like putative cysteine protease